jgi:O-antigen/teichoic acid export membrane protein
VSIRQNSFYTLTGALAQVAVSLFTVPIFLRLIGTERYGVLAIVWVFLGFFGVFDLGLGRATAQRIASFHKATPLERAEVFWTALTLNAAAGVVGGLLLWPVARHFFLTNFKVSADLRLEVLSMVPWMAAAVPFAIVSAVLSGALQGREQFLALGASNALGGVLYQIFPLGVAWLHGPNLAWLVASALLGRVVVFAVQYAQCYRHVPLNMAPSVKRELVAPLFRYGGWVTVTGIIAPVLTTLDRFVIGSIAGASALTYYTVPFNLATRVVILPASLSEALFPRLSAASDKAGRKLSDEAIHALSVILTPIIIAGTLIMEPFLSWWVGPEMAKNSASVGELIALGLWFNGLAYIPASRLQAQGRPDLLAKCHLAEIVPYLTVLAIALHAWGAVGAAVAWSLRVMVDAIALFSLDGGVSRVLVPSLAPLLLLAAVAASVFGFPPDSTNRWVLGGSALVGSLAWAWWAAPSSVTNFMKHTT